MDSAAGCRTASRRSRQANSSGLRGSPHSSHSLIVSGIDGSDIEPITSTNGTSATTAHHRRGATFSAAACSSPPADRPRVTIRRRVHERRVVGRTGPADGVGCGAGQPVRDGGVVGERVRLGGQMAVEPPVPAVLAAAARAGQRVHDAAVEQAHQGRVEPRVVARLVGAVPPHQARRGAVERRVGAPGERDRDERAVGGRRVAALGAVRRTGRIRARRSACAGRACRSTGRRRTTPAAR